MFESMQRRDDFSYAFEKIRNAISSPGENNLYAATRLGLDVLSRKYHQFGEKMKAACYELDCMILMSLKHTARF